jgi:hypothetical protein
MAICGYRFDEFHFHHFYAGGCQVYIYIMKTAPRVFICGGPPQEEPGAEREADVVEIEALAERLKFSPLMDIAAKRRTSPLAIDLRLAVNSPAPKPDSPSEPS